MNNITGEYQALPEEMLNKRQVLVIHFTSILNTKMTDYATLLYTSTCEIFTLLYTLSLKKVPLYPEPPRIGHYRECPAVAYSRCPLKLT